MVTLLRTGLCLVFYFFPMSTFSKDKFISHEELAKHQSRDSCWLLIDGSIYDISSYMNEHAEKYQYDLTKWCGKDASQAWKDKDGRDKKHSRKSHILLESFKIGTLKK